MPFGESHAAPHGSSAETPSAYPPEDQSLPPPLPLTRASVLLAHEAIKPYIHCTPVLTSRTLDRIASSPRNAECEGIVSERVAEVGEEGEGVHEDVAAPSIRLFFKAENLQKGGAFKIRGATHAISRLTPYQRSLGVVTHSSGNHAQALAIAARAQNITAHVVMPSISTPSKIAATKSYGAHVVFSGSTEPERVAKVEEIQKETGAVLVPPYDHADILLGQGTMAIEFKEQVEELLKGAGEEGGLDAIVAPCGGGGMLSGILTACRGTGIKVYGAEPQFQGANDLQRGLAQGSRVEKVSTLTIADGLRTPVGKITYKVIEELVGGAYSVSEEEIKQTLRVVIERMKVLVEPSGVVPLAVVLFDEEFRKLAEKESERLGRPWRVGCVFSGGNTTIEMLGKVFGCTGQK